MPHSIKKVEHNIAGILYCTDIKYIVLMTFHYLDQRSSWNVFSKSTWTLGLYQGFFGHLKIQQALYKCRSRLQLAWKPKVSDHFSTDACDEASTNSKSYHCWPFFWQMDLWRINFIIAGCEKMRCVCHTEISDISATAPLCVTISYRSCDFLCTGSLYPKSSKKLKRFTSFSY